MTTALMTTEQHFDVLADAIEAPDVVVPTGVSWLASCVDMQAMAEEVRAEGWGFVVCALDGIGLDLRVFGIVRKAERATTNEEAHMLAQLESERESLRVAYNANEDRRHAMGCTQAYEAEEQRLTSALDEIEDCIETIHASLEVWTSEQMARLGAVLCPDASGGVFVHRGVFRQSERARMSDESRDGRRPEFSEDLMRDLTAHRTAALQAALMQDTHVALVTLVHRLAETLFERYGPGNDVVKVRIQPMTDASLSEDATGYADSAAGWLLGCAEAQWAERLPGTSQAMFAWLLAQDQGTLLALLAYCTARSIHAVSGAARHHDHSDAIAQSLGLDMANWWVATRANYVGRVTRAQAIQAVREATGTDCSSAVAGMKRSEVIQYCASKLEGSRWLPEPLRPLVPIRGSHEDDERGI